MAWTLRLNAMPDVSAAAASSSLNTIAHALCIFVCHILSMRSASADSQELIWPVKYNFFSF